MRERQLWVAGLNEGKEFEENGVAWKDVTEPCIDSTTAQLKEMRCSNPDRLLPWDSMHLGPMAQWQQKSPILSKNYGETGINLGIGVEKTFADHNGP
ncbi:hypothetical protein PRK78_006307 [Emydomyces testavorans]|uniref:Uncharacterized protein n=1 Tax=Emydomyces testavorans TaxID=2070801 RepID=A0AAF0DL45_9EURO|nr:hypothetical protein PRK78_006307 [Emydomyces testavorans]